MKRLLIYMLLILNAISLAGCGSPQDQGPASRNVCASIYPVYYLTSRVAEGGIKVEEILPPSADPHNWEPSPKQMATLESSLLFIYNGAGLEPWADKVSTLVEANNGTVVDLSATFSEVLLPGEEHIDEPPASGAGDHEDASNLDPHFWLDPVMAGEMAASIKDALIKVDPDNKDLYQKNYSRLAGDLEELHNQYSQTLANCRKKEFVVTHQAFGYLARRYGLIQLAAMGVSSESEPSPARLAELSQLLKEHNISYVFSEPFTSPRVAEALASETGAKVLELNPLGGLTEAQIKAGKDYLVIMKENLQQLKVALDHEE